jgi:hypothetical protein
MGLQPRRRPLLVGTTVMMTMIMDDRAIWVLVGGVLATWRLGVRTGRIYFTGAIQSPLRLNLGKPQIHTLRSWFHDVISKDLPSLSTQLWFPHLCLLVLFLGARPALSPRNTRRQMGGMMAQLLLWRPLQNAQAMRLSLLAKVSITTSSNPSAPKTYPMWLPPCKGTSAYRKASPRYSRLTAYLWTTLAV